MIIWYIVRDIYWFAYSWIRVMSSMNIVFQVKIKEMLIKQSIIQVYWKALLLRSPLNEALLWELKILSRPYNRDMDIWVRSTMLYFLHRTLDFIKRRDVIWVGTWAVLVLLVQNNPMADFNITTGFVLNWHILQIFFTKPFNKIKQICVWKDKVKAFLRICNF